jgi:hypothetical protein
MSDVSGPHIQALKRLLSDALNDSTRRVELIRAFQDTIWTLPSTDKQDPAFEILGDLAQDLDFYEPDPVVRREIPQYYGEDGLKKEIAAALARIAQLGK